MSESKREVERRERESVCVRVCERETSVDDGVFPSGPFKGW